MPSFQYFARNDSGESVKGILAAQDESNLVEVLSKMGLYLIRSSPKKERAFFRARVPPRELIDFSVHLATLLDAGVPLLSALWEVAERSGSPGMREVVENLRRNIMAGFSLSEAVEEYPVVFPDLYVQIVRTGESTGNVHDSLFRLADYYDWQQSLKGQIRQALLYPSLLLVAVAAVIGVMMGFVFPRFMGLFTEFRVELPWPTVIIIAVYGFFLEWWPWLLAGTALSVIGLKVANSFNVGKLLLDRSKLSIPVIGPLIRTICVSRFAHHFALTLRAGISVPRALQMASGVTGNVALSSAIERAEDGIRSGEGIAESLEKAEALPPLVLRMIAAGEQAGTPEETLKKVAEYYDREIPVVIRRLFTIAEPTVILLLGGLVLLVALAILLPIYELPSAISE